MHRWSSQGGQCRRNLSGGATPEPVSTPVAITPLGRSCSSTSGAGMRAWKWMSSNPSYLGDSGHQGSLAELSAVVQWQLIGPGDLAGWRGRRITTGRSTALPFDASRHRRGHGSWTPSPSPRASCGSTSSGSSMWPGSPDMDPPLAGSQTWSCSRSFNTTVQQRGSSTFTS